jgi:hypothetical protein
MKRVEAAQSYEVSVEQGFAFITGWNPTRVPAALHALEQQLAS